MKIFVFGCVSLPHERVLPMNDRRLLTATIINAPIYGPTTQQERECRLLHQLHIQSRDLPPRKLLEARAPPLAQHYQIVRSYPQNLSVYYWIVDRLTAILVAKLHMTLI